MSDSEEFELKRKTIETPFEEEQRIKNEFKAAVSAFEKKGDSSEEEDGFLKKKSKSVK